MTDCSLVGSHQPSFKKRHYAMDPRQEFAGCLFIASKKADFVDISLRIQRKVSCPGISMNNASRLNGFFDKTNQAVRRGILDMLQSDSSYPFSIFLSSHDYHVTHNQHTGNKRYAQASFWNAHSVGSENPPAIGGGTSNHDTQPRWQSEFRIRPMFGDKYPSSRILYVGVT